MNKLNFDKWTFIIKALVEYRYPLVYFPLGGGSIKTVTKLLADTGKACAEYHN